MFGRDVVISQKARPGGVLSLVLGALIAAAVFLMIPLAWLSPWLVYLILTAVCALLVHFTYGTRIRVVNRDESPGKQVLLLRGPRAGLFTEVPVGLVIEAQPCIFENRWRQRLPLPEGVDPDHHRIFEQVGYRGPGLTVAFRWPPRLGGDDRVRAWSFPSPDPDALLEVLAPGAERVRDS